MEKTIHFALMGLGKLGLGFYKIYHDKRSDIKANSGYDLNLKKILVKNANFNRPTFVNKALITTDPQEIINDKDIMIVVDAVGGIEPLFSLIKKLIESKKHIISANRVLLASKLYELVNLSNQNNVYVYPEPAIGGGVPIISALKRDLVANKIKSLTAVLSGVSNYILSEMTKKSISLREALKLPEIQKMGETLSIVDYEGSDAAQKIAILAATAFGVRVNFLHIYAEGIADISLTDIQNAAEFGYEFKYLAILKECDNTVEIRIHPTLVSKNHPLSSVRDENTAYHIETDLLGAYMVYGKGVGVEAASSMILRDMIGVTSQMFTAEYSDRNKPVWNDKVVLEMENVSTSYYLSFPCIDKPGVMGQITATMGFYKVNIASAHAQAAKSHKDLYSYVHIFTDIAKEKDVMEAIKHIEKLQIIKDKIKFFRLLT